MRVLVAGGGIFGVIAALEMRRRGHAVTLCDPGPIPHPLAESTDISKVVRCDYGDDLEYTVLGERSLDGWRRWNTEGTRPLFHETGVAFLARAPMQPGGFEHDSFALLSGRGHRIERLDATEIARRFPAYRPGALVDGYFHHEGGWVEAGAVVGELAARAQAAGVLFREGTVARLVEGGALVDPHASGAPERLAADLTIVCAGSWTQRLVPELAGALRAIGQPVFHLVPPDQALFEAARFPVFGADIARTGFYGFPLANGVVKIANHGTGIEIAHDDERVVSADQEALLRVFLRDTFPSLADAPIAARRLCVYGDSLDGHFWIARHPERADLVVAAGGSGHAFKFAPVLGGLIADVAEGGRGTPRFAWRPEAVTNGVHARGDAARHL